MLVLVGLVFVYEWKSAVELGRWSECVGDEGAGFGEMRQGLNVDGMWELRFICNLTPQWCTQQAYSPCPVCVPFLSCNALILGLRLALYFSIANLF